MRLSVVLPTHDPSPAVLERTLDGLRRQTLSADAWELVIVDSRSRAPELFAHLDLAWHPHARIVRAPSIGLTVARVTGVDASSGDSIVFVDDDNVLDPDYLSLVDSLFSRHAARGVIGGKSIPDFEEPPPHWFGDAGIDLGCRDLGDENLIASWRGMSATERRYPEFAPIGAGMGIRRAAIAPYIDSVRRDPRRLALDRTGDALASGGDNDIVMTALAAGWEVSYEPQLRLRHFIPRRRLTVEYLARMAHDSYVTWIAVLDVHGIRPWRPIARWSLPLRRVRAYWRLQPWRSPARRVRWAAACGQFDGRAALSGNNAK